ncbi:hypothetical protein HOK51_08200 [Candidatus Woesearchaeota archaeon]|jgi:hypothetical protein|nr:hypothetical protein [Candidatus Woesearchaeota archaeon]MBT6519806.1 hypothetical protein [Candidatus Woesearchaeota archaeon]MBT7368185.1 hypothetical protein [Candidatus Woesearchaeota archaeon]
MAEQLQAGLDTWNLSIDEIINKVSDVVVLKNSNSRGYFGQYTTEYEALVKNEETNLVVYVRKQRLIRDPDREKDKSKHTSLRTILFKPYFGFTHVPTGHNAVAVDLQKYLSQKGSKKLFKALEQRYLEQTKE